MSILQTPPEVLKELEKIFFNFTWGNKDRIKRNKLIGDRGQGGLKMLDIYARDKALKAGWIRRRYEKSHLKNCTNSILNKEGLDIEYLLKCYCDKKALEKHTK